MTNPLTEKTYEKLCKEWADVINLPGRNLVSMWYPIAGMHLRIRQFLGDTSIQKKLLSSPEQKMILLDFQDRDTIYPADFEEQTGFELHIVAEKPFFLEEWLAKNKQPIALFIIGLDTSLKQGNHTILPHLEKLANLHSHISILLFTELDLPENELFRMLDFNTPLLQRLSYQPLFSEEDGMQFYKYLEKKWQFPIPSHLPSLLVKEIGPHYLLLKEAGRLMAADPTTELETILSAPSLEKKGIAIFEKLSIPNQKTIIQLVHGESPEKISDYLLQTRLVKNGKVQIPYWHRIKDMLILNDTAQQQNIDLLLTPPERDIMELLQETKEVLTREKIALSLWQDTWEQKYSDWAIDQLIHRLREKLEKTNSPYEIVTKKGEGFYLKEITK